MNQSIKILVSLSIALSISLSACKKEEIELPKVETLDVKDVRRTNAQLDGSKIAIDTSFQTSYGFCWDIESLPTMDDNIGHVVAFDVSGDDGLYFRAYVQGLIPGTTYYVRAYATNLDGTAYGVEKVFSTMEATSSIIFNPDLNYDTVADIEGNTYKTIEIGTQTWMAENLRTTLYSDNTAIPLVTEGSEWEYLTTPAYSWYDNNEDLYKNLYGAYYNWHTVNTGKLCPSGWHVPLHEEWKTMEIFLGMSPEDADLPYHGRGTTEGLKIKETGTVNWHPDQHIDGTNESGFTGLPGGFRWGYGKSHFAGEGIMSYWWTSSVGVENTWAYGRKLYNFESTIYGATTDLTSGLNVRCIKD